MVMARAAERAVRLVCAVVTTGWKPCAPSSERRMGDADDGEILDIKLADLQATVPRLLTHSSDLATALAKLQGALAAAGSPWGGLRDAATAWRTFADDIETLTAAANTSARTLIENNTGKAI